MRCEAITVQNHRCKRAVTRIIRDLDRSDTYRVKFVCPWHRKGANFRYKR